MTAPACRRKARENLFRPFFGSARPGGSGLGLAIARELMRAHGGELTPVSSTGAGTIFRLTLPAAAAPAREHSIERQRQRLEIGGLRQGRMDRVVGAGAGLAQDAAAAPGIGEPAPHRLGELRRRRH